MTSITISVLTVLGLLGGLFSPQSTPHRNSAKVSQAVVFAVDVSANMVGNPLAGEVATVRSLLDKLDETTPLALVTFGSYVQIVQRVTTRRAYMEAALKTLRVEGGTALYDGTLTAVKIAGTLSASRRMVVLLAGNPEQARRSVSTADDAFTLAKARGVSVYSLRWGSHADGTYLDRLAASTHAVSYALSDKEVQSAVASIAGGAPQVGQRTQVVDVKLSGATQTPRLVTTSQLPIQVKESTGVVLAFDVSTGINGTMLRTEQDAARQFVAQAADSTPIALVTFGSQAKLVQPFTVDKDILNSAINKLRTGNGATALYDGAILAIRTAMGSVASNHVVVLLSGSSELGRQSKATRQSVLTLIKNQAVKVYGMSLSSKADRAFLQLLATASGGSSLDRPTTDALATFYTGFSGQASMKVAASADDLLNPAASLDRNGTLSGVGAPNIPPLEGSVANLNLPPQNASGSTNIVKTNDAANSITSSVDTTAADLAGNATASNVSVSSDSSANSHGNVVPIRINIPEDIKIRGAELVVNGYQLTTFDQAPYSYDFDTSALRPGGYSLTFTVHTDKGVTSSGSIDFTVAVPTTTASRLPVLGGASANGLGTSQTEVNNSNKAASQATILTPAQRLLLINGQSRPFSFDFSLDNGLVVRGSTLTSTTKPTLLDILGKPLDFMPPSLREALTAQHPVFWAVVILLMALIFVPQALFTLYWMMYTWNNPETADEYRSPREYVEPQHGFTAILPARHEADVIQDTIRAVDRINYPDHLKEILVMIRDEDDDDTIRRAQQIIDELGKSNIRLITFTTGPKNKPNGLNRGLAAASKDVVCVFDAEDEPHPDLYNVINTVMVRDEADVVQSGVQLMNFTSNWFAALNCMEYFFWFKSGLHCFTRALKVTPLGGNTVFFKKHWLQRINGWDEHCLTEDADVGLRLSLLGAKIQIVYDEQHVTQEETPATAESFIKQRTRWCQGFYEIFFKGDWLKLPSLTQKVTALYILLNSLLQAGIILYLPLGLYVALTQRVSVPISLLSYLPIFLLLIQLAVTLVGIREFAHAYDKPLPLGFRLKVALVYYPYQLMQALAALRAVQHFLLRKNAWEKTSHANLHRQPQPVTQRSF